MGHHSRAVALGAARHSAKAREGSYGRPIYTNVQYPFPIDPPHVPDENPTADHRRTFELPDWSAERICFASTVWSRFTASG